MRLSFIAVTTHQQFRDLLHVRNECRNGLTHDTHELTLESQKEFIGKCWLVYETVESLSTHPPFQIGVHYEPYLLYDEDWPIGYGLLKWDGEKYWMTIGLVEEYRGKGLSRLLTHFITEMGHREYEEVWMDVSPSNTVALKTYLKAGYEFVEKNVSKHDTLLHVLKHTR